jgi:hypothetical protein
MRVAPFRGAMGTGRTSSRRGVLLHPWGPGRDGVETIARWQQAIRYLGRAGLPVASIAITLANARYRPPGHAGSHSLRSVFDVVGESF